MKGRRRGLQRPTTHNHLTVGAEEWLARQFEDWAATGVAPNGTMNAFFKHYESVFPTLTGRQPDVHPKLQGLFGSLTPEMHRGPAATFNVDHFRFMEAMRIALQRAEDEAFKVTYYKRGRNVLERSLNHPYLGMYPVSYMWGKVLPELVRFLVQKPFGIDAPFAGMQMANHVWNAVQLELNTDDGLFQSFIEDYPEALRFLQLMVPGTPWDIPVNAPAWIRRLMQSAWSGDEIDLGKVITDTVMYSYGPGRFPQDISEVIGDFQSMGQRIAASVSGQDYLTEEEQDLQEKYQKRLISEGLASPQPIEPPRLEYGGTGTVQ